MLPVSRVVAGMNAARVEARRQGAGIKGLFELSDRLLDDQPVDNLLASIVTTLAQVFDARVLVERIELSRRPKVLLTAAPPIPTLAAYRRACGPRSYDGEVHAGNDCSDEAKNEPAKADRQAPAQLPVPAHQVARLTDDVGNGPYHDDE